MCSLYNFKQLSREQSPGAESIRIRREALNALKELGRRQ